MFSPSKEWLSLPARSQQWQHQKSFCSFLKESVTKLKIKKLKRRSVDRIMSELCRKFIIIFLWPSMEISNPKAGNGAPLHVELKPGPTQWTNLLVT